MITEIIIDVYSYMESKREKRVYHLKPQKMIKAHRKSANAYWETEAQYAERGKAKIESTANFVLLEKSPYDTNCEFFESREAVYAFFKALRATIISERDLSL